MRRRLLETAINKLGFSARAYSRVLKVGRTIADLAGTEEIQPRPHRRSDSISKLGSKIIEFGGHTKIIHAAIQSFGTFQEGLSKNRNVTICRYRSLCESIKRLMAMLSDGRFYRLEHILAYSSGKVVAKSVNPPDPKPSQPGHSISFEGCRKLELRRGVF